MTKFAISFSLRKTVTAPQLSQSVVITHEELNRIRVNRFILFLAHLVFTNHWIM